VQEYLRTFRMPGTIRATCADYRAGITTDLEQDQADESRRIQVPVRVVWGGLGKADATFDVLAVWREKAEHVDGSAIPSSGHFVAEEAPDELAREILGFFKAL
jgi:haloacetate dehalogenase